MPECNVDQRRGGYSPLRPLFGVQKLAKFAAALRCSLDEVKAPFRRAELAIGPFLSEWKKPAATNAEQIDALNELAKDARSLLNMLRGMDRRSRQRLLNEYGAGGDSEGDSAFALQSLRGDLAAVDRLSQNLTVAQRRAWIDHEPSEGGRPKTSFERFAAGELLKACRDVLGDEVLKPRSLKKQAALRCTVEALMAIGVPEKTAEFTATTVQAEAQKTSRQKT